MRLELGAGQRPTRGYDHADIHPFPHIEHVGDAWMLDLPDQSCSEILALAFVEHLTYENALDTFRNVRRLLAPGGQFLFDVPNYPIWVGYYLTHLRDDGFCQVPMDHVRRTLFGWQRFPGDEHKYGWDRDHLKSALVMCGLIPQSFTAVDEFKRRAYRQRFEKPWDAHLYVVAT